MLQDLSVTIRVLSVVKRFGLLPGIYFMPSYAIIRCLKLGLINLSA